MRQEKDYIGTRELPDDVLYGIHALRARENFPDRTPFHLEWYQAIGLVKKACYLTIEAYQQAVDKKVKLDSGIGTQEPGSEAQQPLSSIRHLIAAATEVSDGMHFEHFIVPGISGGAGTSINMNINEILVNIALIRMGKHPGDYRELDPVEHANLFQSTNDVIPTSLKVAAISLLGNLEAAINESRFVIELHENKYRNDLRIGYTQMQEAVPTSFGKLFGSYSEALSRDWWRVSRCFERIKVVNLGGSAIGTGIAVPRFFIMEAINQLQQISGLPLTRSENLPDATSNLDVFVEVHATLKAHAVNLEKMVSDIRLLASDITNSPHHHLALPQVQVGSSIMPAKINPVIPEFVISAVHKIYANDQLIASLCGQGCLELNAYLPVIGHALLESLKLLIACNQTLKKNLLNGLMVNTQVSLEHLYFSPALTTALLPYIGYNQASDIAKMMKEKGLSIFDANEQMEVLEQDKLIRLLKPENLLKLGYTLNDLH